MSINEVNMMPHGMNNFELSMKNPLRDGAVSQYSIVLPSMLSVYTGQIISRLNIYVLNHFQKSTSVRPPHVRMGEPVWTL